MPNHKAKMHSEKPIQHDNHSSIREVAATNNLRADLSSCLNVMDGDQTKTIQHSIDD